MGPLLRSIACIALTLGAGVSYGGELYHIDAIIDMNRDHPMGNYTGMFDDVGLNVIVGASRGFVAKTDLEGSILKFGETECRTHDWSGRGVGMDFWLHEVCSSIDRPRQGVVRITVQETARVEYRLEAKDYDLIGTTRYVVDLQRNGSTCSVTLIDAQMSEDYRGIRNVTTERFFGSNPRFREKPVCAVSEDSSFK